MHLWMAKSMRMITDQTNSVGNKITQIHNWNQKWMSKLNHIGDGHFNTDVIIQFWRK